MYFFSKYSGLYDAWRCAGIKPHVAPLRFMYFRFGCFAISIRVSSRHTIGYAPVYTDARLLKVHVKGVAARELAHGEAHYLAVCVEHSALKAELLKGGEGADYRVVLIGYAGSRRAALSSDQTDSMSMQAGISSRVMGTKRQSYSASKRLQWFFLPCSALPE